MTRKKQRRRNPRPAIQLGATDAAGPVADANTYRRTPRRLRITICLALTIATIIVYAQVSRFDYVTWDDPSYVYDNEHVTPGLTMRGVGWAFTSQHGANWHPLTGISHMLDCTLFGVDPGPHHLVNVAWHIVCVVVLFLVLDAVTGAPWRSGIVTALFALHPQHVESVAWVSQRKDVLSTALMLLAMASYVRYARLGRWAHYVVALGLFACALMAKPMVVTFPAILMLIDHWPMHRWAGLAPLAESPRYPPRSLRYLTAEKLPFLALSVTAGIMTIVFQRGAGAVVSIDKLGIGDRLAHAAVSYPRYIGSMWWPIDLTVLDPHPYMPGGNGWSGVQIFAAVLFLVAITYAAGWVARSSRYGIVGWLWFLVVLLPVIGLVQVGEQGIADRYTYVPFVGLFIILVWGAGDLIARVRMPRQLRMVVVGSITAVALLACGARSYVQAGYWRDSMTLYQRAIEVAPNTPMVLNNLATLHIERDDWTKASEAFGAIIEFDPQNSVVHRRLGYAQQRLGDFEAAWRHYRLATRFAPNSAEFHNSLAWVLATHPDARWRRPEEALAHAQYAAKLTGHRNAAILDTLAAAYASTGRFDQALITAQRAHALLSTEPHEQLARELPQRIALYRNAQPYRDPNLVVDPAD